MRADLEDLQRQLAPKHLPRAWAVGLGVAAAIALATILFVLNRPPKTVSVAPEIKLRQLTINSSENPVGNGAISPDGKYLAYVDTRGLHLKFIDTGETRTVPKPEALKDQSVKWEDGTWFPDSTRFLVNIHPSTEDWRDWSSVQQQHLGGFCARRSTHKTSRPCPRLVLFLLMAPRSRLEPTRVSSGERELWLMGPNGEQARKFYEANEGTDTDCCGWSPDGKHYLYVSGMNPVTRG